MTKINPDTLMLVIEYLDARYPDQLPTGVTSLETLHLRIGEQNVIRSLEEWHTYLVSKNGKS